MLERLQRKLGLQTIPGVFFTSAGIAVLFVVLAVPFDKQVAGAFGQITGWVARHLGWFYILSVSSLLIFLLGLAVSRYGTIRLGADDSRPDYSNLTWFTMLFAAGIGTILMFWGVAEPVSHFARPPFDGVEPGSTRAASDAMTLALYHFGNAGLLYPRFGFIQHVVAVLQGQFGALPVKVCQLVQQVLPATQPDAASQVRFRGVALFIQNVQQHQRCFHVPAGPGGVITHRGGCPGTVDTGHYS